ncbi:MAG: helix-turn-helix transcriptional regulator [Longimicrobiales bacterium]|nr:helix-turn-helix transcriptional regulator [Longimicrobiales bacterium]
MILALPPWRAYFAHMGIKEDAVRQALELYPGSIRSLAAASGVSEALIRAIRDGERNATPRTLGRIADAMTDMSERQADAARILRDALHGKEA